MASRCLIGKIMNERVPMSLISMVQPPLADDIDRIVTEATLTYLNTRRARVNAFCRRHFSIRGAARLNRKALGKDLLRSPANVIWAGPYLLARSAARLSGRLGMRRISDWLTRLPPGFRTDVEREVEWLIYTELLELPIQQKNRQSTQDALFGEILGHPDLTRLFIPVLQSLNQLAQQESFRRNLENFLMTYTTSRTAAAELTGTLLNLAAGAAAFQKFTPGILTMGNAAAAAIAHNLAVSQFVLGSTLGSLYYSIFPAAVSTGILAGTLGGVMLILGIVTAFAGVVADPVQHALHIHERKLNKLLDALEEQLTEKGKGYRLHDAYVARVFDLWDLLTAAVRSMRMS
jgi:hypothetical protein